MRKMVKRKQGIGPAWTENFAANLLRRRIRDSEASGVQRREDCGRQKIGIACARELDARAKHPIRAVSAGPKEWKAEPVSIIR